MLKYNNIVKLGENDSTIYGNKSTFDIKALYCAYPKKMHKKHFFQLDQQNVFN